MKKEKKKENSKSKEKIVDFLFLEIENSKKEIEKHKESIEKLKSLIQVNSIISNSLNRKEVLRRIMNQTKELMSCGESSVLMIDETLNQLKFEFLTEEKEMAQLDSVGINMGEGVAGKVWELGKPIIINDTNKSGLISKKVDQKIKNKTKSIIAVPLVVKGRIIGVMEAINKIGDAFFSDLDLEIFQYLANQASIAVENAELFEAGITDGMTKLYNHNYFINKLNDEYNRSLRYKNNLSIVIFDIDHFKKFNDNYGHQLGDRVLITVANIIKRLCRQGVDFAARYGGEEFALILPETDKEGSLIFSERIRKEIENLIIDYEGDKIRINISGGVATIPALETKDTAEFISFADKALYHSKENGRNQISFFSL